MSNYRAVGASPGTLDPERVITFAVRWALQVLECVAGLARVLFGERIADWYRSLVHAALSPSTASKIGC